MEVLNVGKTRTTITIDEDLLKDVTELADEEERSISQQIVYFVKKGYEAHMEEKNKNRDE